MFGFSRASNSKVYCLIWNIIELVQHFMSVLFLQVWRKYDHKWMHYRADISFLHYTSMGAFGYHGHQRLNFMQPFPHPSDAA